MKDEIPKVVKHPRGGKRPGTENNKHIWLDLDKVRDLTRAQIERMMKDEAKSAGCEPSDYNEFGRPEIYLRSKYQLAEGFDLNNDEITEEFWVGDGYVMFIKDIPQSLGVE